MSLGIDINDVASPKVRALLESITTKNVNSAIGAEGARVVQAHLFSLESSRPNKLGWPRTNFWARAAKSTSWTVLPDGAVVSINQIGFRQRYQGGTISPRNAKFLTIPAVAEAYGRRAREFGNLKFAIVGGRPVLVLKEGSSHFYKPGDAKRYGNGTKIKGALDLGGTVVYWLVRKVNQKADPSVLPSAETLGQAVAKRVQATLADVSSKHTT